MRYKNAGVYGDRLWEDSDNVEKVAVWRKKASIGENLGFRVEFKHHALVELLIDSVYIIFMKFLKET